MLGINRENFRQASDSNPEPTAWKPCCPKPTGVIYFWKKKELAILVWKKIKTTPLNEYPFLHITYAAKNEKCSETTVSRFDPGYKTHVLQFMWSNG